jgi:manganese/zinc/iron transport system ATP- binding protein
VVSGSIAVPALELSDVSVTYGQTVAIANVHLSVPQGALAAIVGPNGAGKSSLIRAVLGLTTAAGDVKVLGQQGAAGRQLVAYVPQRTSVDWDFPADVLDVVLMGLYRELRWWRRIGRDERDRAMRALAEVGMADLARRQVAQLSGGQQQRVFLARALVQDADVYLLDEPLTGVDAPSEAALMASLRNLVAGGRTVIAVHHDLSTLQAYFDWLALLDRKVVAAGPLAECLTVENLRSTYGKQLLAVPGVWAAAYA